ncbi:LLM class F420-dependent oxidoreductase [Streptomyces sp. NPDC051217]|uniref:LLM class F420-dependent oxidoreductase n=1 Tax=Streptomyces sp. NPDC051217 TaxID=3365644 RepID=UPI00379350C4
MTPAPACEGTLPARWGISIPYPDVGLAEQAEMYAELGDRGYTDFWTLEASGWDAFTPLTMVAMRLPAANVGTAIVPVFSRGAAVLAQSAAAMAELAGDRFTLGLGASTSVIMRDWNGVDYVAPFKRTRDTVRFLRQALSGQRIDSTYDTFAVHGFRLDRPPPAIPRIMLAALRPGMLRMAGEEADGAILSWLAPEDIPRVAPHVGPGKELAARIFVSPCDDKDAVRDAARRMVASYLSAPVYRAFHECLGRPSGRPGPTGPDKRPRGAARIPWPSLRRPCGSG